MDFSHNGQGERSSEQLRAVRGGPQSTQRASQRAFCVAALAQGGGDDLAELGELLRTAGVAVVGELIQRREAPHPDTYLGSGKLQEAKEQARACGANLIACDDELTARQERNLEQAVGLPVVDTTAVEVVG